jgi:hypothetical protein
MNLRRYASVLFVEFADFGALSAKLPASETVVRRCRLNR